MTDVAESLGAAERIILALTSYKAHLWHGRPGIVVPDARSGCGVRWDYATQREKCPQHPDAKVQKVDGAAKCAECGADCTGLWFAYRLTKVGEKTTEARVGRLTPEDRVVDERTGADLGRYARSGIFTEAAVWMYREIVRIWELDNEFAARWASHAFGEDYRDLKVALTAFMLVQSRKGDPVMEAGKLAFHDDDFREVGEAMVLIPKDKKGSNREIDPKMLLRIRDLLAMPEIAEVNRKLGFARSARKPFLGRWTKAAEKWLLFRERNPKMLEGLVKGGYKSTVVRLCDKTGYKPQSDMFCEVLGWRQKQAKDGRRTVAIGRTDIGGGTWEGLTEEQVCEVIVREKPSYKRICGMVPKSVGITKAVIMAALSTGVLTDKDIIIMTPTFEAHGLLGVQEVAERIERASRAPQDMRAANVAKRVKSKEAREQLEKAADAAMQKAVEEVVRGLVVYVLVDISSSMEAAIAQAKSYLSKFLHGFPPDKLHVAVFNTEGRRISLPHRSAAGVENAFRGIAASGGTDYGSGVRAVQASKPGADEDALIIFVGDEGHLGKAGINTPDFVDAVKLSGLNPVAFGLVPIESVRYGRGDSVRGTAKKLGIPCFVIDEDMFEDVYAIPRIFRNLIASTPVGATTTARPTPKRVTLVEQILKTELLKKPAWACV